MHALSSRFSTLNLTCCQWQPATRAHILATYPWTIAALGAIHTHHKRREKGKGLEEGGPFLFAASPNFIYYYPPAEKKSD